MTDFMISFGNSLVPNNLQSRPLFTKKTLYDVYRNPHYKPKTVWRPSQVYNPALVIVLFNVMTWYDREIMLL